MTQVVIDNPILNSPFREPSRHFRFDDQGITNEIVDGRRSSGYFIPIAQPKKRGKQLQFDTEWTVGVSLQWETGKGRTLSIQICHKGDTFGELHCQSARLSPIGVGLRTVPVRTAGRQATRLLECPPPVMTDLFKVRAFERALIAIALQRARDAMVMMSLLVQHEPALALAHLLLSSTYGFKPTPHPTIEYLGRRVTRVKHITINELAQLTGLALNTVRDGLALLESRGCIKLVRRRFAGTDMTVLRAEALIKALQDRLTEAL